MLFLKRIVFGFFLLSLLASAKPYQAERSPIRIIDQEHKSFGSFLEGVIYRQSGSVVVREPFARDEDFENLYAVNTFDHFALPEFLETFGDVLAFEPGKFAVLRVPEARTAELSGQMHHLNHACGALVRLSGESESLAPVVVPSAIIPVKIKDKGFESLVVKVDPQRIEQTVDALAAMPTRFHGSNQGQRVAQWLADKYEELAAGRRDVSIKIFDHGRETPQDSLIVRIEGRSRPEEVIVLGSHIDSVNWSDGTQARSPGADDNASGTATNFEIFRVLMEEGVVLERTLEIHGYAAEEIGLVGSADIARDYRARNVKVLAMVQHDMTGWKTPGSPDKIWFVTSNTESGFNDQLAQLVDHYVGIAHEKASLGSGSSDHASWRRIGVATAFPFENPRRYNQAIHTAKDTLNSGLASSQMAAFAKLGLAYALHFGGANAI